MSYASTILADSPSAYYRLGEASGTVMTDSTANGRNGAYTGGVTLGQPGLIAGDPDTCPTFSSGQGKVTYDSTWLSAATFSVEGWFRFTTVSGTQTVFSRYSGGFSASRFTVRADNSSLTFYSFSGNSFTTLTISAISANTTYYVAVTYDGTTANCYLNGSLAASAARTINTGTTTPFVVAAADLTEYASGKVDEVAYYPTVLTATQISAHYNAGLSYVIQVPSAAVATAIAPTPAWNELVPTTTSTSNAGDGRSRSGLGLVAVTRPVSPLPAGLSAAQKYDKTAAYPTPTMVNGRPT